MLQKEYSLEQALDDKFVTRLIEKAKKENDPKDYQHDIRVIEALLNARLAHFLTAAITDNEKRQFEDFRNWMNVQEKDLKTILTIARKALGIESFLTTNTEYTSGKEAFEDLLYQIWFQESEGAGDFDEDILGNSKNFLHYAARIEKVLQEILNVLALDPGWEDFLIASIASPNTRQTKILYAQHYPLDFPIVIYSVKDEYLIFQVDGGIEKRQWDAVWKAIKPFAKANIGSPLVKDKISAILSERSINDSPKSFGIPTLKDLALKYYPEKCYGDSTGVPYTADIEDKLAKLYKYKRTKTKS